MNKLYKQDRFYKFYIENLIPEVYYYHKEKTPKSLKKIFVSKDKVYILTILGGISDKIELYIYKINFLKSVPKFNKNILYNTFFTYCVECGKIHAQHKYKSCNHYVNYECGLNAYLNKNECKQCKKKILKNKLELVKSKKKDTCSICLEETKYKLKKCGHHFHKKCIKLVQDTSNKCPMCRDYLTSLYSSKKDFKNIKFNLKNDCHGEIDVYVNNL